MPEIDFYVSQSFSSDSLSREPCSSTIVKHMVSESDVRFLCAGSHVEYETAERVKYLTKDS